MSETPNTLKTRNPYWDVVKALLIFLVVLGHSIQYLHQGGNCFAHPLFKAIYLFHMPLFALISGYFARGSIKRHGRKYLFRNAKHLLIPSLTVAVIGSFTFNSHLIKQGAGMESISCILATLWFLLLLFGCSVFLYILMMRGEWWWRTLWCILPLCAALSYHRFPLDAFFVFLYPFYLLGVYLNHKNFQFQRIWVGIASAIIFIAVYCIFSPDWYVYNTPLSHLNHDLHAIQVSIIRMLGGLSGGLLFLFLIKHAKILWHITWICSIGKYTLAIYALQSLVFSHINMIDHTHFELTYCILFAIILLLLLYGCVIVFKKNRVTRVLFLGETK